MLGQGREESIVKPEPFKDDSLRTCLILTFPSSVQISQTWNLVMIHVKVGLSEHPVLNLEQHLSFLHFEHPV